MEPSVVVIVNIQTWHGDREVHTGWVVGDVEEDIRLPCAYIPVLNAFAYHIGEELRHHSGGKSPRCEWVPFALLIDHIGIRLDL
jgi:hypothetical protein